MRRTATAVAWLALVASLAACGSVTHGASGTGATSSPTPKDPKAVLVASTPTTAGGTFQVTAKQAAIDESGTVDPAGRKLDLRIVTVQTQDKMTITVSLEFLVADGKVWLKATIKAPKGTAGLPKLPTKWMLLDPTKLDGGYKDMLQFDNPDPTDVSTLLQGLVSAQETGTGQYRGTIDLTRATGQSALDAAAVTALGDAAKALPFTATLDDKARMTAFTMTIPAAGSTPASTYTATFSDYGGAPALAAPVAGESQTAPAVVYSMLAGS